MARRKTCQEFIQDAKVVHGNYYDYQFVEYKNTHTLIKIVCPVHGLFKQRPNRHLQGDGCKFCGYTNNAIKHTMSVSEIIEKAKRVHGNKFTYDSLRKIGYDGKGSIIIGCKNHGDFIQRLTDHLHSKAGCPTCANKIKGEWRRWTRDEFIEKANVVHDEYYDYTKTEYISTYKKLEVICPIHGSFFVTPGNHVFNISGCPCCFQSKGEQHVKKILDMMCVKYIQQYTFEDCYNPETVEINKRRSLLRFDFFIPEKQLLIEYDGFFHYNLPHAGVCSLPGKAKLMFKNVMIRDHIKNIYVLQKNISLLRINYKTKQIKMKLIELLPLINIQEPVIINMI